VVAMVTFQSRNWFSVVIVWLLEVITAFNSAIPVQQRFLRFFLQDDIYDLSVRHMGWSLYFVFSFYSKRARGGDSGARITSPIRV